MNNPLVFGHLIRLLRRNWKPFLLIVVPAVAVVWFLLPSAVASVIFLLAFAAVILVLVGGFLRNLRRGWTGQD